MSLFGNQNLFNSPNQNTTNRNVPTSSIGFGSQTGTSGFSFGVNNAQNTGLFQSTANKMPTLGFGTQPQTGFGAPTTTTSSLFGSNANKPLTGAFNTSQTGTFNKIGFGQTSQNIFAPSSNATNMGFSNPLNTNTLTQQPQTVNAQNTMVDSFFTSLSQPMLFSDERDSIVARWNQLLAMWGTGIGYSALGMVKYDPENAFARFKAIGYNVLPTSTDADGLVCLYLGRPFTEVSSQRQAMQDILFRILVGRPNMQLIIEEIRPYGNDENTTEVIFKVIERLSNGCSNNIPASELFKYLSSPTVSQLLQSQLCAKHLIQEVSPSAAQLAAYNENPPAGFDKLIWQQALSENPRPDRMLPVPFTGFLDLKRRKQDQINYSEQQREVLKLINEHIHTMRTGQVGMCQKVVQLKRKQIEISHRILKALTRQELHQRSGFAISAQEEAMRCELERMWSELTASRGGLRIRFQEALATLRSRSDPNALADKQLSGTAQKSLIGNSCPSTSSWTMDSETLGELKQYLAQRHTGIKEMQRLIKDMKNSLKVMESNPISGGQTNTNNQLAVPSPTPTNRVSFAIN